MKSSEEALAYAEREGVRIRLHYGDTDTGRDWMDQYDVAGRIGRSMGPVKVRLIIANSRSIGGPAVLEDCIVRIRHANKKNGGDLYRHPKYHEGETS